MQIIQYREPETSTDPPITNGAHERKSVSAGPRKADRLQRSECKVMQVLEPPHAFSHPASGSHLGRRKGNQFAAVTELIIHGCGSYHGSPLVIGTKTMENPHPLPALTASTF